MSEVRTVSSSGGEKGVKPEAFDLIPWDAMDEVARVYEFGSRKYAAHNWRKGYEWGKSFAAACRHLFAFWRGEDRDPESGLLHVAHAVFHMLTLITFVLGRERYAEFDDRYKPIEVEMGASPYAPDCPWRSPHAAHEWVGAQSGDTYKCGGRS